MESGADIYPRLCEVGTLREAWTRVRHKNARGGIDGVNPADLDARIEKELSALSRSLAEQTYAAAPMDRIKVPKFNKQNEWRPLSMPVVRDKIVQQALVDLIGPLFDAEFMDVSYAYRPRKGAQRAIKRVEHILASLRQHWAVTMDIDNFFDTLDHGRLLDRVRSKIGDERVADLISQWLKAGYITGKGKFIDPEEGIPQGAVISPLLSNVYLHPLDAFAVGKGFHYLRYSDNFITLSADREKAFVSRESLKGFIEEELALKLNAPGQEACHLKAGFVFLGIYFKGEQRRMSHAKEEKTIKKLSWLTDRAHAVSPQLTMERINQTVGSHRRYYGFIKPERQFAVFDAHLEKRLPGLLEGFAQREALSTQKQFEDWLRKIEFYGSDDKERQARINRIARQAVEAVRAAQSPTEEQDQETPAKVAAGAAARRGSAMKNRYLRQVGESAEVVVATPGVFIGKIGQRLVLKKERRNIHEQPFSKIRQISVITSGVSLSSDVIWSCGTNKVPLCFLNKQGGTYALLHTPMHAAGDLSVAQSRICETEFALSLARRMLTGKCRNQMNVIKFYTRHRSKTDPLFSEKVAAAVTRMENDLQEMQAIRLGGEESFEKVRNRLFMVEARISGYYWDIVKLLLPVELAFEKRVKRGAADPVNNMLNYGYGVLYQRVWQAVSAVGLNPNIGFLHALQKTKPVLVFDLVEEFRQALVDRPLFSLMTRGTRYKKLRVDPATGLLDNFSRELTLETILHRLSSLISYRGRKVPGEEVIQAQVKSLAGGILDPKKKYRPFITNY